MDVAAGLSFLAPSGTGGAIMPVGTHGGLPNTESPAIILAGLHAFPPPGPGGKPIDDQPDDPQSEII